MRSTSFSHNPTTTTTMECSHCGEIRTHGQPHDDRRCATIARAFAAVAGKTYFPGLRSDAPNYNIVELSRWLRDHPQQRGAQQYTDRQVALARWIAIAQRTEQ